LLLTGRLRVLGSLDLRAKTDGIAVSPDGQYLGSSLRDRTCVMTARGEVIREVRHDPWSDCAGGGCTFSPDGLCFWAVRPSGEERQVTVEVTACDGWRAIALEEFEAEEDGYWTLAPHPEGEVVGLWVGAGQAGQWLYWSALTDERLYVEEEPALDGTGPPVFHPAGGEFLTDSLDDGLLRRHRFPSGKVIGQITDGELFPSDDPEDDRDPFSGYVQYLTDCRAMALSSNGRLSLLDLGAMRFEGAVPLEGRPLRPHRFSWNQREHLYGDVEQFLILPGGRLLTVHRNWIERPLEPDYEVRAWDVTSVCEGMRGPDGDWPHTEAFFSHFLR
jgi:hypothetical protein